MNLLEIPRNAVQGNSIALSRPSAYGQLPCIVQRYALAICNFLGDQMDGQAQYVFEPTTMEDHFDRTAFELEVVRQVQAGTLPKSLDIEKNTCLSMHLNNCS